MLALQACLLGLVVLHVVRVLDADRGKEGIVFLTWRDIRHPQAGGSEVYVEEMARRMARSGRKVTVFCAAHPHAPPTDVVDGVRFVRRGSWRTVYVWAALYHLTGRFGSHDVVVDVQNGISFFSPLYCGRRVVALVHHVHREQWGIVFGPRLARAGWWVESRVAPVVHRRSRYVAVSNSTRDELVTLGVDPDHISVVRNGSTRGGRSEPVTKAGRPTLVYLGRLVPHKRVDLLLEAAARLVSDFPALQVDVIGRGMWEQPLRSKAERLGLGSRVRFQGFVEEAQKQRLLGEAWVLAQPSVKEGWGLSVVEAAAAGTPAVAFAVGGLRESVLDGETGILADSFDEFTEGLRRLLRSPDLRDRMGQAARGRAATFTWDAAAEAFLEVLTSAQRPPEPAVEPQPVVAGQPAAI
jgi:glycosyltransferase involved in cell wall biosynthesis